MPYVTYTPGGGIIHGLCLPSAGRCVEVSAETAAQLRCGYDPYKAKLRGWKEEAQGRLDVLQDYVESHPNDWIAQWLYKKEKPWAKGRWGGAGDITAPAWIGEAGLGITGEPTQEITGYESLGWDAGRKPVYEEVPGEIEGLRPMGAQMSLTSDQMEQLMYYYGFLESEQEFGEYPEAYQEAMAAQKKQRHEQMTGQRETTAEWQEPYEKRRKEALIKAAGKGGEEWLKTIAYRLPNWWYDYLAMSEAAMPKVSPPKAQISAAWQR